MKSHGRSNRNVRKVKFAAAFILALMLAFAASAEPLGIGRFKFFGEAPETVFADSAVWGGSAATAFAGGTGASANPYLISTAEQLKYFANVITNNTTDTRNSVAFNNAAKYYALTDNILLNTTNGTNTYSSWTGTVRTWTPIGGFKANFDGRNYAVRGVYINNSTDEIQGLFGTVSGGKINNLGVEQSYIRGLKRLGGIAGQLNSSGIIKNCWNSGTVIAAVTAIVTSGEGGIVGSLSNSLVDYCRNSGSVTGLHPVGGIVGICDSGSITNSYNTGAIKGTNSEYGDVGGITGAAGWNGTNVNVLNCYNTGAVSGGYSNGGIVGMGNTLTIRNCYNTGTISGSTSGGVFAYFKDGSKTCSSSAAYCYTLNNSSIYSSIVTGGTVSNTATFTSSGAFYSTSSVTVNGSGRTTLQAAVSNWTGWTAGYTAPPSGVTYATWNTSTYPAFSSSVTVNKPAAYAVTLAPRAAADSSTVTATIGDLSITSGQLQQADQTITFTAAPASGYALKQWYSGGALSSGYIPNGTAISGQTAATYSLGTRTAAAFISHEFQLVYTITVAETTGGSASPTSGPQGATSTLSRGTVPTNQVFMRWDLSGTGATVNNTTNVLTIGTANVTATARWGANMTFGAYQSLGGTVTAAVTTAGTGGTTGTLSSGSPAQIGSTVTFTAAASSNWRVKQWRRTVTGSSETIPQTGTAVTYVYSGFTAHTTINPEFEAAVTYNSGANGTGSASTVYKTINTNLTLSGAIFSRTGYTQTGWNTTDSGSGTAYALSASYTTNAPLTLYPVWTAKNGIGVTFAEDGGTLTAGSPVGLTPLSGLIFDKPYGDLPELEKGIGYNFGGWWTGNGAGGNWGTQVTAAALVKNESNHTLYARWLINEYSIAYRDAGGGTLSVPVTGLPTTYTTAAGLTLANPASTRTGYTFAGWFLDENAAGDRIYALTNSHAGNITLYAKWTPNKYIVRYYSNHPGAGATASVIAGSTAESEHTYGKAMNLTANAFSLSGWHFTGWAASTGGAAVYADEEEIVNLTATNNALIELYAVWERNAYEVVYHKNKPETSSAAIIDGITVPSSFTYDNTSQEYLRQNMYTLTGWTFAGWSTRADTSWLAFDPEAHKAPNPLTDTSAEYHFTDGQSVKNLCAYGSTVTLYAVWRPNTYKVYYDGNMTAYGGKISGVISGATTYSEFTYDQPGNLKANGFSLTGWTFDRWLSGEFAGTAYGQGTNGFQSVLNLTDGYGLANVDGAEITLYAQWTANAYTIQYNANQTLGAPGSSGAVTGDTNDSAHKYDSSEALTLNGFSLTGWTFGGWARNADGTGAVYSNGQHVKNFTSDKNPAPITLYAIWRANTYTVKYDKNSPDAVGATLSSAHTYDSQRKLSYNGFSLTGWTFDGWTTNSDGSGTHYSEGEYVDNITPDRNGIITLYAKWAPAKYNVTFKFPFVPDPEHTDSEGNELPLYPDIVVFAYYGNSFADILADYDGGNGLKPPEIDGMVFVRWEGLVRGITNDYRPDMKVTGDHVFTAVYRPAADPAFTVTFLDKDGEELLSVPDVPFGTYIGEILPETPAKPGWKFIRWEGFEQWMTVTGNHTFTAVMELDTFKLPFTVTFYDLDGATALFSVEAYEGAAISPLFPAVAQRSGYVFTGWDGYTYGMTVSDNHKFTAQYRLAPVPAFTVFFTDEDGAAEILRLDDVPQGTYVSALLPPPPIKEGFTFVRWDGIGGGQMTVEGNLLFRAIYIDNNKLAYYTVTFIDDDGISIIAKEALVIVGTPVSSLFPNPAPFKPGYIFAGWLGYTPNMMVSENINLTATYARVPAPTYSVIFMDAHGGVFYQVNNVAYGTLIAMLVPPSAPIDEFGRAFVRWDKLEQWMTVTGNCSFLAVYQVSPAAGVTVTFFNEDEISVIAKRENVLPESPVSQLFPQALVKSGFVFIGWQYKNVSTGLWNDYYAGMLVPYENISFKAVYAADSAVDPENPEIIHPIEKYTVTFNNYNGTEIITHTGVYAGTAVSSLFPAPPSRQGFISTGWEYMDKEGEWVACVSGLKVTGDMVIHPVYTAVGVIYVLTVDGKEYGRFEAGSSFYIFLNIEYGYEFNSWRILEGVVGGGLLPPDAQGRVAFVMPVNNVEIEAVYSPIPIYTATFMPDNGTAEDPAYAAQNILRDGKVLSVAAPQRQYYAFDGWYIYDGAAITNQLWDFNTDTVSGDIILMAKWIAATYKVTINDGWPRTMSYVVGVEVLLWVQNKDFDLGYRYDINNHFICSDPSLNIHAELINGSWQYTFEMPAYDVVIEVMFKQLTKYMVEFNLDGGAGDIPLQYVYDGEFAAYVLPPSKDGHIFIGWFEAVDNGGGVTLASKAWNFSTDKVAGDLTLTAKWTATAYNVRMEDGSPRDMTYLVGVEVVLWLQPKEGGRYNGFTVDDPLLAVTETKFTDGRVRFTFEMPKNNVTVTVNFIDLNLYAVAFDPNGGSMPAGALAQSVYEGGLVAYVLPPSRAGDFVFLFWYDAAGSDTIPWDFASAAVTGNLTLRARWQALVSGGGAQSVSLVVEGATGSGEYASGSLVTLYLQIPAGKEFEKWIATGFDMTNPDYEWKDNGGGGYTFIISGAGLGLTAAYKDIDYTVTVIIDDWTSDLSVGHYGGRVELNPLLYNNFARFEITSGNAALLYDDGGYVYYFIMPAGNVCVEIFYNLSGDTLFTAEIIDASGYGDYAAGETVTVWLQIPYGMKFDGWELTGIGLSDLIDGQDGGYTFEMPACGVIVKALYAELTYIVRVDGAEYQNGFKYNDIVVLAPAPAAAGQKFVRFESADVALLKTGGSSYGFYMPAHDVSLTAVYDFILIGYNVVVTGANGSGTYADGTFLTVRPEIPSGKTFAGWNAQTMSGVTAGGIADNGDGSYTFVVNGGGIVLDAVFADIPSFKVTFDADGAELSEQIILEGGFVKYAGTPIKDGYRFLGWYDGDEEWDFTSAVTQNVKLTAKWEKVGDAVEIGGDSNRKAYVAGLSVMGGIIGLLMVVLVIGIARKNKDAKKAGE